MSHTEALLFINDRKPQIFEIDIFGDKPVRTHHNIYRAIAHPLNNFGRFFGWGKTAEQFYAYRILTHAAAERAVVLVCQHSGGRQNCRLFSTGNALEGSAYSNLSLAEAHITAYQAVHGAGRFHISLALIDGSQLIRRFAIGE